MEPAARIAFSVFLILLALLAGNVSVVMLLLETWFPLLSLPLAAILLGAAVLEAFDQNGYLVGLPASLVALVVSFCVLFISPDKDLFWLNIIGIYAITAILWVIYGVLLREKKGPSPIPS